MGRLAGVVKQSLRLRQPLCWVLTSRAVLWVAKEEPLTVVLRFLDAGDSAACAGDVVAVFNIV